MPFYRSSDTVMKGDVVVRIGSIEKNQPYLRIIHNIFFEELDDVEELITSSPGFVEFSAVEESEFVDKESVDSTELILTCEDGNEVASRFRNIGLLEIKGCKRELSMGVVKKMSFVVEDTENDKTIYIMKELTRVNDVDDFHAVPAYGEIGSFALGNEFRVLCLLHDDEISDAGLTESDDGDIDSTQQLGNELSVLRVLQNGEEKEGAEDEEKGGDEAKENGCRLNSMENGKGASFLSVEKTSMHSLVLLTLSCITLHQFIKCN